MASLLEENVFFMWLSGMSRPDFRAINRFRSERLADGRFESIFHQVVELLHDEGLISLDVQYIDGTKIESVANKYTFVWMCFLSRIQRQTLEARSSRPIGNSQVMLRIKDIDLL